jgi:hypothetical protein
MGPEDIKMSTSPSAPAGAPSTTKLTVDVFYDQADGSLSLVTDDPRLTDENGQRPGFRVTFNGNAKSADYNPANFNRLARFLVANGKPAPAEVPLRQRQLNRRSAVIAEVTGEQAKAATGRPADAAFLGWTVCPSCTAVVTNLPKHKTVSTTC